MPLSHFLSTPASRAIIKFTGLFFGYTILFFFVVEFFPEWIAQVYIRAISYSASFLLQILYIDNHITLNIALGDCTLVLHQISYRITQGCTGLFTSLLYTASVLAYPIGSKIKRIGLVIGIPAFFVFGTLRVVIMGIVAVVRPSHIEDFHIYYMAIANLGFALFIWIYWFNEWVKK
ncbi:MAG: exosortase/archaeosortase family protein [Candidatus Latescibacterota bacterium]|jgi:exosortase/archaeosortase family protein